MRVVAQPREHLARDVDADDMHALGDKRQRDASGSDADLEHVTSRVELGSDHGDEARQRRLVERPRTVVVRGRTVERDRGH